MQKLINCYSCFGKKSNLDLVFNHFATKPKRHQHICSSVHLGAQTNSMPKKSYRTYPKAKRAAQLLLKHCRGFNVQVRVRVQVRVQINFKFMPGYLCYAFSTSSLSLSLCLSSSSSSSLSSSSSSSSSSSPSPS